MHHIYYSILADMTSGDEDDKVASIAATPISKIKDPVANVEISSTSSKRKLPPPASDASTSRSAKTKRNWLNTSLESENPGSHMQSFFQMAANQIPEETVAWWDGMNLAAAAKATILANAESFFHYLKHGERIVEAARGDQKLAEKKKFVDANKKLKSAGTKLLKERDQLANSVAGLVAEKEELVSSHAKQVHELELKMEAMKRKAVYDAGYNVAINDYIRYTHLKFPDLDWSQLGEDAVKMVEDIKKKEKAAGAEVGDAEPTIKEKETEVPVSEAAETQAKVSNIDAPTPSATTPVASDTPTP